MKRMKNACIKTIFVILLSVMGNALFAQNSTQISSKQLNLYAVNSMEGLRVRSAPSLEGKKIGLLEYQETVVLDNISSSWFKVKSVDRHWNKTADLWDKLDFYRSAGAGTQGKASRTFFDAFTT